LMRRCIRAWSSWSSRCLAFSWPELESKVSDVHKARFSREQQTYSWACLATPFSRREGSKALPIRSCRVSMISTPA
jgi:hypothetical protein